MGKVTTINVTNQTINKTEIAETRSHSSPITIMVLALIIATLGPFASDSYLPSLPAMVSAFNTNSGVMQLTITLYLLGFALSQLIYGPLSDRYGRRIVVLAGLSICLLGSILCAIAFSPVSLILARFVQGTGMGVGNTLFRAIMRDTFNGTRLSKMASYAGMGFAFAPAIAPILGGYIQVSFGWHANFIFIALLVGIIWLIVWRFLPETNQNLDPTANRLDIMLGNYLNLISTKTFVGYALCSSFAYSGLIAYCAISPFLFQNVMGFSAVQYGWLATAITVGLLVGQFLNSVLVSRFNMHSIMQAGIGLMLLSSLVMFLTGKFGILNVFVIVVPTCIFIAAGAFIYANAMAGAFAPLAKMAGVAGAMYGCLQIFGTFITSLLVTGFHVKNQLMLASIFILLSVMSYLIFHTLIQQKVVSAVKKP